MFAPKFSACAIHPAVCLPTAAAACRPRPGVQGPAELGRAAVQVGDLAGRPGQLGAQLRRVQDLDLRS